MKVIRGRCAEVRLYLQYSISVFRPGIDLPAFGMRTSTGPIPELEDEDLHLVIDEGRRQLDRQAGDLERIRGRGATVLAVALAEIALLGAGAEKSFDQGWLSTVLWWTSAILITFAIAGTVTVLSGKAILGRIDTALLGEVVPPCLPQLAKAYIDQVSIGEETVRAFLTVLRDAVHLAVLGGLVYAYTWALTLGG